MLLHCTQKLAAKLPTVSKAVAETSPIGNWHAHLYTIDRRNVVLFCHDQSRFTLFLPGLRKAEFADLRDVFVESFSATLASMGEADSLLRQVALALGPMRCDKSTDRSVLGSLNQMKIMLDARVAAVEDVMLLDPIEVNRWLNHTPVSARGEGFWFADEAMLERVAAL